MAQPIKPPEVATIPEIPVRLTVPQPVFDKYMAHAAAEGMDVEVYMSEHLRQTVDHEHSPAALHFNALQAKRLCALTGRGPCNSADEVLKRLEPLSRIKVGDLTLPLDANVLERISHNYQVRKGIITPEQFALREGVNGIRTSVALPPINPRAK